MTIAPITHVMEVWPVDLLFPNSYHDVVSERTIRRAVELLRGNGWYMPVVIDPFGAVLDGLAVYWAAKRLGMAFAPVVVVGCEYAGSKEGGVHHESDRSAGFYACGRESRQGRSV